ncbi:hypothetical protein PL705_09465 [Bifidobacterium breve]|nr:hypothetical protein [Bifidobacterium breve]MDB1160675.1 hypothetical protein [Bifidobacterium breve]MDB1170858.1 hypothetical protein [Bifidobacterium breve]
MNGIFRRLFNVKGMVVGSARIVDGPLRPEPVPEVHARREGGAAPLALRAEATWSWPGRRRAPLAAPRFRLLEGGAGRHDAARLCFVKFLWAVSAFLLVRLSGCF